MEMLSTTSVKPENINMFLENQGTSGIKEKTKCINIAKRPQVGIELLLEAAGLSYEPEDISKRIRSEIIESVEIRIKYEGYISREKLMAEKILRLDKIKLDPKLNYDKLNSLSTEARQKLGLTKPATIGQASRISGVSPSDISVLLIYMGR